jgi:hypothetical protein
MEGRAVGHNFERDPPRFGVIWFSSFREEDLKAVVTKNRNFFNCPLLL